MGTPAYATTILKALVLDKDCDVVLLVTQEDKPVGRKQILTPPDTKAWIVEENIKIPVFQPKSLRNAEAIELIASCNPDFIIVAAYGKLLPKDILEIAPCINLHASLLPLYRGASPIQSTLLSNDRYTGVTSMLMEEGMDTGAMLGFSYHLISESETAGDLFEHLAQKAALLTLLSLQNFGSLAPLKQVNADASHCKKIKKEDGEVSLELRADEIMTKFKALTPWPGIFLPSGLKLLDIDILTQAKNEKKGVIDSFDKEGITVTCKENALFIKSVQPISKSPMRAVDYIRGKRLTIGDRLA